MNNTELLKYLNTVKYLRFKQIYYQLYYRIFRNYTPKLIKDKPQLRTWVTSWQVYLPNAPTLSDGCILTFLNQTLDLRTTVDWNDPDRSKLWLYNLHYFDCLSSRTSHNHTYRLNKLIEHWIDANPINIGVGWDPYTLSLRIVNWVKWFSNLTQINEKWILSLKQQTEVLLKKLEYHIQANHLFANAKSLIFAGCYFSGSRGNIYLKKGLKLLDREVDEQFLEDGGHYELSPMYHSIILWDLCELADLAKRTQHHSLLKRLKIWKNKIIKSISWLEAMCHPDGEISFFNDAAFGIAPKISDIKEYAEMLQIISNVQDLPVVENTISLNQLRESGYCSIMLKNACKAIIDLAPIGLDFQPGHAHADTLSFELSLHGQRFIVNSGTSTYETGKQRFYERSTQAHNTVRINKQNSSEVWASFRVARRAYPKNLEIDQSPVKTIVRCAHTGYTRSPINAIHWREWMFLERSLKITDNIKGNYDDAEAYYYFHPDVNLQDMNNGRLIARLKNGSLVTIDLSITEYSLNSNYWYPQFGISLQNKCLIIPFRKNSITIQIFW